MTAKPKKILFVIVEDRYFISHRLHLAQHALKLGYEVGLISKNSKYKEFLTNQGIKVFDWSLVRGSFNIFYEVRAFFEIIKTLIIFSPDLIHAVALKPVIYSSFASKLVFLRSKVFALGGLGFIFSSQKFLARILRPIIVLLLKFAFSGKKSRLIIQNVDDMKMLTDLGVIKSNKVELIKGAGVDINNFSYLEETGSVPEVILPARLLWDKGVGEFVKAAKIIKDQGIEANFSILGEADPHNPECISDEQITDWKKDGFVKILGFKDDVVKYLHRCSIVCLPSYREGLPKALLEAASCGRPIVTTNVPGCREIVQDGINGYLVPPRDSVILAQSLSKLISDKDLRISLGRNGRLLVEKEFSDEIVSIKTAKLWSSLIK
tara:strand:+ start:2282 stop:3415 length:1134 start_codon:yes stop_codon:yes gene_type:complete